MWSSLLLVLPVAEVWASAVCARGGDPLCNRIGGSLCKTKADCYSRPQMLTDGSSTFSLAAFVVTRELSEKTTHLEVFLELLFLFLRGKYFQHQLWKEDAEHRTVWELYAGCACRGMAHLSYTKLYVSVRDHHI